MNKSCLNCEHSSVCCIYTSDFNDNRAINCFEYLSKTKHYQIQPSINHWYKVVILYGNGKTEHKLFTVYTDAVMFYTLIKSIGLKYITNVDFELVRIGGD